MSLRSAKTKLSIIIPSINEGDETLKTVESIKSSTNKNNYEIIVIDDYTNTGKWVDLPKWVKVIHNDTWLGRPKSVQKGIDAAKYDNILVLNARMRFIDNGWNDRYIDELNKDEKSLICSTCVCLSKNDEDFNNKNRKYGAYVNYFEKSSKNKLFGLHWNNEKPENEIVNICLGASTATTKKWWNHIHGLNLLENWGCADAYLSLKTWISGGKCKIMSDVEIGNIFRQGYINGNGEKVEYKQHYVIQPEAVLYNRMVLNHIFMSTEYRKYIFQLNKHRSYKLALMWYLNNYGIIEKEKQYIKSIKKDKIENYINLNL